MKSAALGSSAFFGLGAGALPTGSAVVSDVIDSCRNLLAGVSGRLPMLCAPHLQDTPVRSVSARRGPYYLRFSVSDAPGVLGRIAGVLGEKGVSIAQVVQRQTKQQPHATVVVFTHDANETAVQAAVRWIDGLETTARAHAAHPHRGGPHARQPSGVASKGVYLPTSSTGRPAAARSSGR